jgi:hypothetical protein
VVPVSISSGVIVASFGDGTGNDWEPQAAGSWDARGYAKLC